MVLKSGSVCVALVLIAAASLASAFFAGGGARPAAALGGAGLAFSPAASTISPSSTPAPVDVTVANATAVAGYEVWVAFNGSVAHLDSLSDSGFLANPNPSGTPQNTVVCTTPTVTASYGYLACNVVALPSPFPPPVLPAAGSTPVSLVRAKFSPAGSGTSSLSLTAVANGTPQTTLLLDASSTPIPATLSGGTLIVSGVPASVGGFADLPGLTASAHASPGSRLRDPIEVAALVAGAALLLAVASFACRRRTGDG